MASVDEAMLKAAPLSLAVLTDLGRQSLQHYFTSSPQIDKSALQRLHAVLAQTACNPHVVDKHLIAACNALNVFIRCAHPSAASGEEQFVFSEEVYTSVLTTIHRCFSEGKNKSALQVLEVFILIVSSHPEEQVAFSRLKKEIVKLVVILIKGSPQAQLKETCIMLFHLLKRLSNIAGLASYLEVVDSTLLSYFSERCMKHGLEVSQLTATSDNALKAMLYSLLFAVRLPESRAVAMKLFSFLCSDGESHDYTQHISTASECIQIYLRADAQSMKELSTVVFHAVLVDENQFHAFLGRFNPHNDTSRHSLGIFLDIIQVGREKGFLSEEDLLQTLTTTTTSLSASNKDMSGSYVALDTLLSSLEPQIRLKAMKLLTSFKSKRSPISADALQCLARNAMYLHDDSDAYYRDEYTSTLRQLFQKIFRSAPVTKNSQAPPEVLGHEERIYHHHEEFIMLYLQFLVGELAPNTSYPRHILALRVLRQIVDIVPSYVFRSLLPGGLDIWIRMLISLILDPFEDVRDASLRLLQDLGCLNADLPTRTTLSASLQLMKTLAAGTNRADHADALGKFLLLNEMASQTQSDRREMVARSHVLADVSYVLLSSIEHYLQTSSSLSPASNFPLHGNMLGIAYQIDDCPSVQYYVAKTIYDICSRVWNLVYDNLCVDSPERTTDLEADSDRKGPKDLLAYSWRALNDSSLMVQATICKYEDPADLFILDKIGSLCLAQLINLRHRGAFTTVAQTFAICCERARQARQKFPDCIDMIGKWQKEAFHELQKQATKLTRRSAGLPAIFIGLLDPAEKQHFLSVIDDLASAATSAGDNSLPIANQSEQKLPQVHALNCIKDIMMNSKFRTISESIVVEMLSIAARSMTSDIWAIRNCGLMLLSSCIGRLCTDCMESCSNTDDAGESNTSPLALAIDLLHEVPNIDFQRDLDISKFSEHVFAALDLLGRLWIPGPSHKTLNYLIETQYGSMIWAIREQAARLGTLNTGTNHYIEDVTQIFSSEDCFRRSNEIHGRLICVKNIVHSILDRENGQGNAEKAIEVVDNVRSFVERLMLLEQLNPFALAVYLDVLNDIYLKFFEDQHTCEYLDKLSVYVTGYDHRSAADPICFPLARALVLNILLRYLRKPPQPPSYDVDSIWNKQSATHIYLGRLLQDADTALFVMEHIASATVPVTMVVDLYIHLIIHDYAEDVRAMAMLEVVNIVSLSLGVLSAFDLQQLEICIQLDSLHSRALFDAEILLGSSIIESRLADEEYGQEVGSLDKLINALQFSLLDEIETPSRVNAALALGSLSSLVVPEYRISRSVSDRHSLRIGLLIWDLLNDDDEDIRGIAAGFTNSLLAQAGLKDSLIPCCALAARQKLLNLLHKQFGQIPEFTAYALMKVIGAEPSISMSSMNNIVGYTTNKSIRLQIEKLLHNASDLFAEEKQNLYIDEISEIHAWLSCIDLSHVSQSHPQIEAGLRTWAGDGLSSLTSILDSEEGQISAWQGLARVSLGPLGPSYHGDMLILSLRVVHLTIMLLQRQAVQQYAEEDLKSLHEKVRKLRAVCQETTVHPLLMLVVNDAYQVNCEVF